MRDGVALSAHIHRPAAAGQYPALMSYTPYRKGPLGAPPPIVAAGYASVTFDIRGTGDSSGSNDSIYSAAERQDGYDMVEWIAAQPWCTGKVGIWGISFGAVVALQMARLAPPHLKAIIARSGTDDPWTEWTNPGGAPRPYMYQCYAAIMSAWNFAPPDPAVWGERWQEVWDQRLQHNRPWGLSFLENLQDGPFWRDRSLRGHYDQVRCAVYVVGGWADWYHTPLLRTFANLGGPKRGLIGPWSHQFPDQGIPGPRVDWLREATRWWDYWLKDEDNGIMDEPPLTVFVRDYSQPKSLLIQDRGQFRCESEWPPARAVATPFYFAAGGQLETTPPTQAACDRHRHDPRLGRCTGQHGGGPGNINWLMPLDQRPDDALSLSYTTAPLSEPLEVTGVPRLILHVAVSATSAQFVVKLEDVAPDGQVGLVTKGYLNASHGIDPQQPKPLVPGDLYRLEIDLLCCAYRYESGHCIRATVAGADFLNIWPTPEPCVSGVFHGADCSSHLVLPLVPPQSPVLPEPNLTVMPVAETLRAELTPLAYEVSYDDVAETATARYDMNYGAGRDHAARYTVSAQRPAVATIEATADATFDYPDCRVVSRARCLTRSDAATFTHAVELIITVNDKSVFEQSWDTTVPRGVL